MSHFVECNIKAWEGADNPPPWCNCQTIAEVEIKAQRDMLAKCIAAVESLAVHIVDVRFDMDEEPEYRQTVEAAAAIAALRALQEKP